MDVYSYLCRFLSFPPFLSFSLFLSFSFFFSFKKVFSCVGCISLLLFCLFFLSLCTRLSLLLSFPLFFSSFRFLLFFSRSSRGPYGIFSSSSSVRSSIPPLLDSFLFFRQFFFLIQVNGAKCDDSPRPPRYINFFTISILAGDHLVVPIGVSHISLRHKKYNQGSGRKKNKEQTRTWINASARRLSCDILHSL